MALNDKKTLYQSHLVSAGPVQVTVKANAPQASKFKDRLPYIPIMHDGFEHWLELENQDCEFAMSGLQGQTVTITASGTRADARIDVGEPFQHQPPPRQQHQQQAQPPPRNSAPAQQVAVRPSAHNHAPATEGGEAAEKKAWIQAKKLGARCGLLMQVALKNATEAAQAQFPTASSEDIRAMAITIFIEMKGQTTIHNLPTHIPAATEPKPPRQQAPPPPPPPPPPEPEHPPQDRGYDDEDSIPF